jgi:hypothetical protein
VWRPVDPAHKALLAEIRRRLEATRDDPNVVNRGGSNYWGPRVTRAINDREDADDGPGLVQYIKGVLRKTGESEGWDSLLEGDRLDISFEDMVLHADEPIRSLFNDEDREIAARSLGAQQAEIGRRRDAMEATAVEKDREIVAMVAASRREKGQPWTTEMEQEMLAKRAAERRKTDKAD